jgi:hypothetical protein
MIREGAARYLPRLAGGAIGFYGPPKHQPAGTRALSTRWISARIYDLP